MHHLTNDAMRLLALIGSAPAGLPLGRLYESEVLRQAYPACSHAGLTASTRDLIVLTDAGAALLGLQDYRGNDPSTWPAELAEKMFLRGYCHALAVALHRLFGHELVMASKSGIPFHVLVRRQDGALIDYDGETTLERIQQDSGLGVTRLAIVALRDEADLVRTVAGRLADLVPEHVAMATRFILGSPARFPLQEHAAPSP